MELRSNIELQKCFLFLQQTYRRCLPNHITLQQISLLRHKGQNQCSHACTVLNSHSKLSMRTSKSLPSSKFQELPFVKPCRPWSPHRIVCFDAGVFAHRVLEKSGHFEGRSLFLGGPLDSVALGHRGGPMALTLSIKCHLPRCLIIALQKCLYFLPRVFSNELMFYPPSTKCSFLSQQSTCPFTPGDVAPPRVLRVSSCRWQRRTPARAARAARTANGVRALSLYN